jgi:non-ribosomal peptide synthetase component F
MHSITSSPDGFAKVPPPMQALDLAEPLRTWSGTRSDYPRQATVTALFEEIASQHPEAVALIQNQTELTYRQLNARANRLAHRLRRAGVKPETMVGCCVERSVEMIVALLGILKAGGAYVPLDPDYPKARLEFILQDTGKPLIVTRKSLASALFSEYSERIVALDDTQESLSSPEDENPQPETGPTSLAYVMYTSGSTGKPKGVMVEHRGIVRLVRGTDYCQFGADEVFQ